MRSNRLYLHFVTFNLLIRIPKEAYHLGQLDCDLQFSQDKDITAINVLKDKISSHLINGDSLVQFIGEESLKKYIFRHTDAMEQYLSGYAYCMKNSTDIKRISLKLLSVTLKPKHLVRLEQLMK